MCLPPGRVPLLSMRVRALGGHAVDTLAEFVQHTRLQEEPAYSPNTRTMVATLLADHETLTQ